MEVLDFPCESNVKMLDLFQQLVSIQCAFFSRCSVFQSSVKPFGKELAQIKIKHFFV